MGFNACGMVGSVLNFSIVLLGLRLISGVIQSPNLVANGDFSAVSDGVPVEWKAYGNATAVAQKLSAERELGQSCAHLSCTKLVGEGGDIHAMIAQIGKVNLRAGQLYEFSCRARERGIVGGSIGVAISDMSNWTNCGLDTSFGVGPEWRPYRCVFKASKAIGQSGRLQISFLETGDLYLSDVRIVETKLPRIEMSDVVSPSTGKNLLPNSSFEVGAPTWSSYGIPVGWGGMIAHLCGAVTRSKEPDHPQFLRIAMGKSQTPVLGFDYPEGSTVAQTRLLAANRGWIRVTPNKPYTLSCDMRASRERSSALLGYSQIAPELASHGINHELKPIEIGARWARYSYSFVPTAPFVYIMVGPEVHDSQSVEVDVDRVQLEAGSKPTTFIRYCSNEISVEPNVPSGLFMVGEQPSLTIRSAHQTGLGHEVHLEMTATDFYDRVTKFPLVVVRGSEHRFNLPPEWRGWFKIQIKAKEADVAVTTPELRIAIVPPMPPGATILGVNHAFADPYLIDLARKVGVSQYRDWSLQWDHIEPKKGQFQWSGVDSQIGRILDRGVDIVSLLPPFPSASWSSTAPKGLTSEGDLGDRIRESWAPEDPADLARYAGAAVDRYKGRIHTWEFLNEPLYTSYSLPSPQYGPSDYVKLLRPTAKAIRKADPDSRVIGGVAAGPGRLNTEMFKAGLLDIVDVLNLHIYPSLTAPEKFLPEMADLVHEMDLLEKRKPIWITEFSYYGIDNPPRIPFIPEPNVWAEDRLLDDEKRCADYTIRFLTIMLYEGVERVFLHSGTDSAVNEPVTECCFFDYGGVPRKVAPALAVFCSLMGSKRMPMSISKSPNGFYGMVFEADKNAVAVLWSTGSTMTLDAPQGTRCLDEMGNVQSNKALKISQSPVYVVAPSGASKQLGRLLMQAQIGR